MLHIRTALIQAQEAVPPQDSCALWAPVHPTFFSADESSICFFRIADVNEEGTSHNPEGMNLLSMLHGCLHTSIPLDKVDNIPHGKASVSRVTFPGSKKAFLLLSKFITLCLKPASHVHFDFCPVTQSLSRYASSQSTDFRKRKPPQTCN